MPTISYQLFSSRDHDLDETFAMLADLGIENVEGFAAHLEDPQATRALLDKHGLSMPSCHFPLDMVEADPDRAITVARMLGIGAVIIPYLKPDDRPTDRSGWHAFAGRVAKAGEPILAAGLRYGWHNHDFEFTRTADGCLPIEEIAAASPDIGLELDLAWIHVAGHDPAEWVNRFSGRIIAAHMKDRAPAGEAQDEGGWADLGYGEVDYTHIIPALNDAEVDLWVLEHDNPSDHARFASRSFQTVSMFAI
jgi:sugar phosphate isomerase/epimerase